MSDLALYRKYRSANFEAVLGQPQVVQTLKNAIASDRLSHAYLFTGPKGVGKTSVARLLARAANCTNEDPAKRPCGECQNCQTAIGGHLDLIEIDAASNRGIDDARALREKITSAPSMGRYKIYIIDEVHMLTTEAFNALLKTLEEPPEHAIFIMATTEAHKLPETIISRTQRFTFRPIPKEVIAKHLAAIAKSEKIDITPDALELIAKASHGGFRDAISLLDQVRMSGKSPLEAAAVREALGQTDPQLLTDIATAVMDHRPADAIAALDQALAQGVQPAQLATQLIDTWRATLSQSLVASPIEAAKVSKLAQAIEKLVPVLKSAWPQLSLEATIVQLATEGIVVPAAKERPAASKAATTPSTAEVESAPSRTSEDSTESDLWMKALTQIKQRNNSLYALLRSSVSVNLEADELQLGCRFTFHRDRLKEPKNIQLIEQALARVYGRKFRVRPQLETQVKTVAVAANPESELVSSALEILGGEVIHE